MLKFVNSIREYNISYGMEYLLRIHPVSDLSYRLGENRKRFQFGVIENCLAGNSHTDPRRTV